MDCVIASMASGEWKQIHAIYAEGIATGHATFEADAPNWETWDLAHLPAPRLVARSGCEVLGWGALSRVSGRSVYAGVAEVSVYVGEGARSKGTGTALLGALVRESENSGLWTLQAGIFPENRVSIALHRKHGFRKVGHREKIGRMRFGELKGAWRDVILFERRSRVVGVD